MPPSHRKDAYVSDDRVISARLHFLTSRKAPASAMAPRNRDDNFMDVDSDSDISLLGDAEHRGKGKGKSKATDKRKKDKGKAKAKEVSKVVFIKELYSYFYSKRIPGRHPIRVHGTLCRKMRLEVCRAQWRILWRGGGGGGPSISRLPLYFH